MASDKGAKLCSDGTYMVVATDVTAYQNPKKERPPFVPVEKKEVFIHYSTLCHPVVSILPHAA